MARTIVGWFLEEMDQFMNSLEALFVSARTALFLILVTIPSKRTWSWIGCVGSLYFQGPVRLREWWRWASVLLVTVARVHRTLTISIVFQFILFTSQDPGFERFLHSLASRSWERLVLWLWNLILYWWFSFEFFIDRIDYALLEKGSYESKEDWFTDIPLHHCLHKGVRSWSAVDILAAVSDQDSMMDHLCDYSLPRLEGGILNTINGCTSLLYEDVTEILFGLISVHASFFRTMSSRNDWFYFTLDLCPQVFLTYPSEESFALVNVILIWSSLFSAWLLSWTTSSKVFAKEFALAAPAAALACRPIVAASRFPTVWKNTLLERFPRLGSLFPVTSSPGRNLFNYVWREVPSSLHQRST